MLAKERHPRVVWRVDLWQAADQRVVRETVALAANLVERCQQLGGMELDLGVEGASSRQLLHHQQPLVGIVGRRDRGDLVQLYHLSWHMARLAAAIAKLPAGITAPAP
jgi:hypothetical protein